MLVFLKILVGVYAAAMNAYSFMLLKSQRDSNEEGDCENSVHDGKLFFSAILDGALGIFVGTFVLRYRRRSMFLMVLMPVLIVANAYLYFIAFTGDLLLYRDRFDFGSIYSYFNI